MAFQQLWLAPSQGQAQEPPHPGGCTLSNPLVLLTSSPKEEGFFPALAFPLDSSVSLPLTPSRQS